MICPHSTPLHTPELTDRASKPKSVTMDGKMCHYKTIHNIKLSLALPQCTRFTGKNRKTNDKIAEYHTLDWHYNVQTGHTVDFPQMVGHWGGGPRARVTGVAAGRPLVTGREGEVGGGRDHPRVREVPVLG